VLPPQATKSVTTEIEMQVRRIPQYDRSKGDRYRQLSEKRTTRQTEVSLTALVSRSERVQRVRAPLFDAARCRKSVTKSRSPRK
jgi:hypothetical protein